MAHEDLPIPIYSSLEPVYGEESLLEEAQLRFNAVKAKFVELFGQEPQIYARSPGEVVVCLGFLRFAKSTATLNWGRILIQYYMTTFMVGL